MAMTIRLNSLAPFVLTAALLSACQPAQGKELDLTRCMNSSNAIPRDQQVAECSSILQLDNLTESQRWVVLTSRAFAYNSNGQLDRARQDLDAAISIDPTREFSYYLRGGISYNEGDNEAAIADLRRAVEIDPNFAAAHSSLGLALASSGDTEGGLAAAERALELEPDVLINLRNRSAVLSLQGNQQAALNDLDKIVEMDPTSPISYASRALVRLRLDDLSGAEADAEQAVRLGRSAGTLGNRGLVRLRIGDHSGAFEDYNSALEMTPQSSMYLYGRGLAATRLGRTEAGQQDMAKAITRDADVVEIFDRYNIR